MTIIAGFHKSCIPLGYRSQGFENSQTNNGICKLSVFSITNPKFIFYCIYRLKLYFKYFWVRLLVKYWHELIEQTRTSLSVVALNAKLIHSRLKKVEWETSSSSVQLCSYDDKLWLGKISVQFKDFTSFIFDILHKLYPP